MGQSRLGRVATRFSGRTFPALSAASWGPAVPGGAQGEPRRPLQAEAPRTRPGRWHRGPRPARPPGVGKLTKGRLDEGTRGAVSLHRGSWGVPSMWFLQSNCLLPASPRSSGSEGPREASGLKDKTKILRLKPPDAPSAHLTRTNGGWGRGLGSGAPRVDLRRGPGRAAAPFAAKGLGRRGTRAGAPAPVN